MLGTWEVSAAAAAVRIALATLTGAQTSADGLVRGLGSKKAEWKA